MFTFLSSPDFIASVIFFTAIGIGFYIAVNSNIPMDDM